MLIDLLPIRQPIRKRYRWIFARKRILKGPRCYKGTFIIHQRWTSVLNGRPRPQPVPATVKMPTVIGTKVARLMRSRPLKIGFPVSTYTVIWKTSKFHNSPSLAISFLQFFDALPFDLGWYPFGWILLCKSAIFFINLNKNISDCRDYDVFIIIWNIF